MEHFIQTKGWYINNLSIFFGHKVKQFYKKNRYTMLFVVEGDEFDSKR